MRITKNRNRRDAKSSSKIALEHAKSVAKVLRANGVKTTINIKGFGNLAKGKANYTLITLYSKSLS